MTALPPQVPTIVATDFDYLRDCWLYAMSDGAVIKGQPGDARIPAGLPFNARIQWGANQVSHANRELRT